MEAATSNDKTPWQAHEAADAGMEKPEIPVIAALAGGFVLAKLIGAIFGDDD